MSLAGWLLVATASLLAGGLLGALLRPRSLAPVVVGTVIAFGAAVSGMIASAWLQQPTATTLFGLASIAIPAVGALASVGALVGRRWRPPAS